MSDIDVRIENKLQELLQASEKMREIVDKTTYWTRSEDPRGVEPVDIFESFETSDNERLKNAELAQLLAEKFPERFSDEVISYWREEESRLRLRLESWKRREIPKS